LAIVFHRGKVAVQTAALKFKQESSFLLRLVEASNDGGPLTFDSCEK
jgi:hypothetical protein